MAVLTILDQLISYTIRPEIIHVISKSNKHAAYFLAPLEMYREQY